MKKNERMICARCAEKLTRAEMTYSRSPGKDNIAVCAFCRQERPCKCYVIITQK